MRCSRNRLRWHIARLLPYIAFAMQIYRVCVCNRLKTVCIPSKVTKMDGVFDSCLNLEKIEVASDSATFASVDGILFDKTTHTLLLYPPVKNDRTYTVPDGTEAIAKNAFYSAKFAEIVLPDSVRSIGDNAFLFCENLTEVRLPEGVEKLGRYAFQYCTRLQKIILPDSLRQVGTSPYLQCEKLSEIVLSEAHPAFTLVCGCLVQREDMLLIACPMALQENTLAFPAGIRAIGTNAFKKCKDIEEITFEDGLEEICSAAFNGCSALKRIVLPASLSKIDKSAFPPDTLKNTVFVVTSGSYAETFCTSAGLKIEYAG